VEEKLYKRLTRRLLVTNAVPILPSKESSHTINGVDDHASAEDNAEAAHFAREERQRRTDTLLDFAAFESNIVRAQLLINSNERERQRYAEEKTRIMETAHTVRGSNGQLHEQLKEAQRVLQVRKGYDELALMITKKPQLRSRDDQHAALMKLNAEIADLEHEREEYSKTWTERREQFGRIVEEGMQMLRLIRDEKEEAERLEGMEDVDNGEDGEGSATGTPKASAGGATPMHTSQDEAASVVAPAETSVHPLAQHREAEEADGQTNGDNEDAAMADNDDSEQKADAAVDEALATEEETPIADNMDTT